ncbi:MAG: glutamate--cysteine ligase, partial [Proteobacteria bacterium]
MSKLLHLFDAYGIEMEYMIVNRDSLDVMPITDKVIESLAGEIT